MSLPYYKKFPRDFLEGTVGMSLELKGAYAIVLDLIYMRDGRLPDDARYIAGQLGCSVRKWTSLRNQLVEMGKINVDLGIISNFRADYLLEETRKFRDKQAENRARPNKIKALKSPASHHTDTDTDKEHNTARNTSRADDVRRVYDHYNRTAEQIGWVVSKKLTDTLRKSISGRIRDYSADEVCGFIDYLARQPWTSRGFSNNQKFRASLGYVMRPRTFAEHFDKAAQPKLEVVPKSSQLPPIEWCFKAYSLTGDWYGDKHGFAYPPEHPKADYPAHLYDRYSISKHGEAA